MKQTWLWALLPLTVLLAVFGFFFALFPDRFLDSGLLFGSVSMMALAAASAVYSPVRGFVHGWSVSALVGTVIAALMLLISASGVAMVLNGFHMGAMIAGLVTVIGFVLLLVATGMDGAAMRRKAELVPESKGSPKEWAERLEAIGHQCARQDMKTRVLRLGGETRFLTESGSADPIVDQHIGRALEELAQVVRSGDDQSVISMLSGIRSLFAQRENQLKP
ncbi:MAG TPA: hypothetical protein ENL07_06315 [Chlorobaculum parvum]|uniref:Uncharacterized protein n=1 Tax=Chlorobaculum parvum TaxID=274539 RepID=A0A7C5DE98_9CHLB|nr:hypothetical protein [Chlorobaculum parvum]